LVLAGSWLGCDGGAPPTPSTARAGDPAADLSARTYARNAPAAADAPASPSSASPAATPTSLLQLEDQVIEISQRVTPSVVHIEAIVKRDDRRSEVTGSGVITGADGRILTNYHVVEKAEKVQVVVPGIPGKLPARIVGLDKQTDLALLRIEPRSDLVPARFGSADEVRVGQWVLAVGNPYGLDGTVSLGIVSAKGRNLGIPELLNDFIQTDAMIDRGSSGGPLVDLEGRVVGINSRGQGRGIGFTIPIDTALQVMRELEAGGVERSWLGVALQPLDRELAAYYELPDATGVVVNSVAEDSPAARAGLRTGDILTRFAGEPIAAEKAEDLGHFQRLVASFEPGRTVEIELLRDRRPLTRTASLSVAPKVDPEELETEAGFYVQEITDATFRAERLRSRAGAYVSFVASGSPAAEAGLEVGDVVRRIEGDPVDDLASFEDAMANAQSLSRFLITAERGDETLFLLLRPGVRPPSPEPADPPATPGEAAHPR
jgi:serine protease Do